jgi:putative DNA primase/helicase
MVKAWATAATYSPFMIATKWGASPDALPAIPVGAHGLVVIDCDRKPGAPDGVEAFRALRQEHGIDLSAGFQVDTPSGGQHWYFRTEIPYGNSSGSLPAGIDVRGMGGYVIGPGATLPDGRAYKLVQGTWDTIPALPDSLAALLKAKKPMTPPETANLAAALSVAPDLSLVTERDLTHGRGALASAFEIIRTAPKGTRNKTFSGQAIGIYELVANGSIPEQEADETIWRAIEQSGYFADKSKGEAKESLKTAKNKGLSQPRTLLSDAPADKPSLEIVRQSVQNMIEAYKRKQGKATGKRSIMLLQCSTIQAKPITWLWNGYLPSGKLTLLAGAGGTGKSTIAFSFTGIVSNGGAWPDNSRCNTAGNVLIWSSEDDAADTILPRLMAVGANLSRCGIISGAVDEDGLRCPFDAASDMGRLREAVQQIDGIALLIVDPIVTAVTGDMHKANDVRRSLQAIVDFASEMNCAVLGITHFAKGTAGKNSAERVIGSQAFAALARMVLVTAKEEDSQNRVFTRAKSNNSEDTGGFSYTIEAGKLAGGIVATRILWGEPLKGSSRSILSEIEGDSADEGSSKLNQAKAFLLDKLKNGFVPQKELFEHAHEIEGITDGTMRRAGKALSITPRKLAMNGGWVWELPITVIAR